MVTEATEKRVKQALKAALQAVSGLQGIVDDGFSHALGLIARRKGKILVTGVGKSSYVAMKMAATLTSLGHPASFLNALDALHGDSGIVESGDILIVFSFSGSSRELIRLIQHFQKHFKIKVVAITGKKDSTLANLSDGIIHFSIADEGSPLGLAPMASTTASMVIADCIASALTSPDVFKAEHFAKFHPAGSIGLSLKKVGEVMRKGKQLPMVSEDASFEEVLKAITRQKVAQIVGVVDDSGRLIGAVADGDIRRMLLKRINFKGRKAHEFMNKVPCTVGMGENLQAALSMMTEAKVNSLLVIDRDMRYIGFIHLQDIVG